MTNRESIQRILSLYAKGVQPADARLTKRHIYNKLVTVRERLIVQEIKKNQRISEWSYQTIPCVEMDSIPLIECPCVPPLGMFILRSRYKFPAVMTDMDDSQITVLSLDGERKYDSSTWEDRKYSKGNKYTATKTDHFFNNGYLYLTAATKPEKVAVRGLAANPVDWALFPYCCDYPAPCINILDLEFPMEGDLFEAAIELAAIELIDAFNKSGEDKTSNTSDDGTK